MSAQNAPNLINPPDETEEAIVGLQYHYVQGPFHWYIALFLLYPSVLAISGTMLSMYLQDVFFTLITLLTSTVVWFLSGVVADWVDSPAPDPALNPHWAAPEPILAWMISWQFTLTVLVFTLQLRLRGTLLLLVNLLLIPYVVALIVNEYMCLGQVLVTAGFALSASTPGLVALIWLGYPLSGVISNSAFGYALGYTDVLGETLREQEEARRLRESWRTDTRGRWRTFLRDGLGWPLWRKAQE